MPLLHHTKLHQHESALPARNACTGSYRTGATPAKAYSGRITSYNVCYTKLLRHLLNAETQNHGEVVIPAALLQIPNPLQADTLGLMLSRVASGEDNKQSSNGILAVIELERGKQTDSYWLSLEIGNSIASDTKSSIGTLYSSTGIV